MSRPSTRNKNKRNRPEDELDAKSEILRRIHSTGNVTDDDLAQLYNIRKTNCHGCRVNTKDNPNCFCGLIPPPTGSRKAGLWQKISDVISSYGSDPTKDLRSSVEIPAGLTNLGATCYANSILQFLYMNRAFREGIFSVEPHVLLQQPVLDQLARLFAQLHGSKMAFIDSAPFIQALELDNGVQQDSHEFLTLLLSLVEQCLSHSVVPEAKTIVQDLFRGSMSHVTRCSKCGQTSEASSNLEDFYELELNVKGLKSLDESLNDYLSEEKLEGDNQYHCESCGTRVDATRSIKLRTLPPVLNFQLKRCVFLQKTTTKKKITSAFSFPEELDMGKRLSEPSESAFIYGLSAVLVHKGTAVNSGHYVAHIKDESSGQWWEFDDEHVSNLGHHPFGEGSSCSASKTNGTSTQEVKTSVSDENHIDVDQHGLFKANSRVERYSSSDAYMLMYTLRPRKSCQNGSTGHNAITEKIAGASVPVHSSLSLPPHLADDIKAQNDMYLELCENYNTRKEQEINTITERRQEVRSILSEAPVLSLEEPYFWISMDWLRQWADNVTISAIDNTNIQCMHGKVPVSNIVAMKRLSAKAWTLLCSKYNGGPCLGKDDFCKICLTDSARAIVTADSYRDRRAYMKEFAEAALAGSCPDGKQYYISKTWLHQWLRRKASDNPSEADTGPTASIRCPHGQLMPEQAPGAKRVLIPESLWIFLHENSNLVKPDDQLGCSTFSSDAETCTECRLELTEVASWEDTLREIKLKQRQNHEKLALGKAVQLSLNCKYYLLPSFWLSTWRSYINTSGKNSSSTEKPERLDNVIRSLICTTHSRLLERPLGLTCKRGVILQKFSATEGLLMVSESDWRHFCEEWDGKEERGILAEIEFKNLAEGLCQEMPITEEHMNEDQGDEFESREPVIKTSPEVCEECIGEKESCELMRRLNYSNEDICVCFVRGKEPPKSILEASGNNCEADRRTSKRSRKTSFGNSKNLKVSGSTTIYQLKMMIWESFGVVKENQILHKGSKVIEGEADTLADFNIFPADVLWVTDSEIHEYRDIADELSEQKFDVREAEEGFRGTLLTSNSASQVV
ncbi:ubiquitin carboxyl-terminal hydrolase 26-like isoform X1 [Chenopodium quinoa]|uniref:Ubiquitin carboxyl-terminal hydrolase 26 n=1 Tax=Chenopodium quinoa TaxID=63459 RepID=A0A803LYZ6_CHEQI|nr:ubiquitin carboxyl-terminal hydrolase 26-like isoform X1 [Chenopodium quinoa]